MEDDVDLGGEHGPEIVRISRGMLSVSERGLVFLGRAEEENTMSKRCRFVATDYEDYEEGNEVGEDIFTFVIVGGRAIRWGIMQRNMWGIF